MAARISEPTEELTAVQGKLDQLEKTGNDMCHLQASVVTSLKTRLQTADQANVLEISRQLKKTLLSFHLCVKHLKGLLGEQSVDISKDGSRTDAGELGTGDVASDGDSTDGLVNLKNEVQDLKRTLAEKEISMNEEFRKIQEHIRSVEERGSTLVNMAEVQTSDLLVFPKNHDLFKESEDSCVNKQTHYQLLNSPNVRDLDLPSDFQSNELAQTINMLSKFCVKIKVTSVCNQVRVGSGWVYDSEYPRANMHIIRMCTSDKLVWDAGEVDHIDVTFNLTGQTVTWKGGSVVFSVPDPNCDMSVVTVDTNDGDLINTLPTTVANVKKAVERVNKKLDRGQTVGGLAVLFSNPHGVDVSKIAIGNVIKLSHKQIGDSEYYQLETTLPTCVGCNGGLVWPVGWRLTSGKFFARIGLPHCEKSGTNTQLTAWWTMV